MNLSIYSEILIYSNCSFVAVYNVFTAMIKAS